MLLYSQNVLTSVNFYSMFCDSYRLYCFILSCIVQLRFDNIVALKKHLISCDLMYVHFNINETKVNGIDN